MNSISYQFHIIPDTADIISVYTSSGINRPTADKDRIEKMYVNSNLVITAWDDNILIGIARSLTDFCYACYLSDLAVRSEYQKRGVGRMLISLTQNEIGPETSLILIAAPSAVSYYPAAGFEELKNGFIIRRKE